MRSLKKIQHLAGVISRCESQYIISYRKKNLLSFPASTLEVSPSLGEIWLLKNATDTATCRSCMHRISNPLVSVN